MAIRKVFGSDDEYALLITPGETEGQRRGPSIEEIRMAAPYGVVGTFDQAYRRAGGHTIGGPDDSAFQIEERSLALATNLMLGNGARFYVDSSHPEYCTPECTSIFDYIAHTKAGDLAVTTGAADFAARMNAHGLPMTAAVYHNNHDHKGDSWGTHVNFLVAANALPEIMRFFPIHLITSQIFCGGGRVGGNSDSRGVQPRFQLSQRADFTVMDYSLDTMHDRGVMNTRDEPHSGPDYARLHVINFDANMSELATFLKIGTSCIVLAMIEDGWLQKHAHDLVVTNMAQTFQAVSRDITLKRPFRLADGSRISALEAQARLLTEAKRYAEERGLGFLEPGEGETVLELWEQTLQVLEQNPMAADGLDWPRKLALIDSYDAKGSSLHKLV
ncbi:MAG: proteasome accessory factor PafA2 family protein, partial [Verrucomicrobia bacterium]|nr:proteasome accessory factor PafA2 family protein [Verrucomicrobiota bacterium]